MPFRLNWVLGTVVEGTSSYVHLDETLEKLSENELAGIIKKLKSNKNIRSYKAVYFGDQDITDRIMPQ